MDATEKTETARQTTPRWKSASLNAVLGDRETINVVVQRSEPKRVEVVTIVPKRVMQPPVEVVTIVPKRVMQPPVEVVTIVPKRVMQPPVEVVTIVPKRVNATAGRAGEAAGHDTQSCTGCSAPSRM